MKNTYTNFIIETNFVDETNKKFHVFHDFTPDMTLNMVVFRLLDKIFPNNENEKVPNIITIKHKKKYYFENNFDITLEEIECDLNSYHIVLFVKFR